MKKLFLLIIMAFVAMASNAQDYKNWEVKVTVKIVYKFVSQTTYEEVSSQSGTPQTLIFPETARSKSEAERQAIQTCMNTCESNGRKVGSNIKVNGIMCDKYEERFVDTADAKELK